MKTRWRSALAVSLCAVLIGGAVAVGQLPALGAGGLLHPARRHVTQSPPPSCRDAVFAGADVRLSGWRCDASGPKRGTIVLLHGVADNRTTATGITERFNARGFDVVAYDSRAHGESDGNACTYGFFEKQDLRRVLDTIDPRGIVLVGTSLGAAVALQEAAEDPRVTAVVAAETFSDLRIIAAERAPFFFTKGIIAKALRLAEQQGHFVVDDVSPRAAASRITAPVLLIHGAKDRETALEHSRRVFEALNGPKRFIIVPEAGHNHSLRPEVWQEVERWIDNVLPTTVQNRDSGIVTLEVGTGRSPLILLHGYGSSPQEWLPFTRTIRIAPQWRFVFPEAIGTTAPRDGLESGRAWWNLDLSSYRRRGESVADLSGSRPRGLGESAGQIRVLLKEIKSRLGSKPGETILGGFSQGALIASDIAFRTDERLRALVILSGTFVDDVAWTKGMSRRQGLPVFIAHGRGDTALKFDVATRLQEGMRRAGIRVTWVPFDGGHEMPSVVVTALNGFLVQIGAGQPREARVPSVLTPVTTRE
jgi:pimeloyl-ACP methyl ester carboxylesterase